MTNEKLLCAKEVSKILGVSQNTIYNLVNKNRNGYNPDFPKPVSIGGTGSTLRWQETDIREWLRLEFENNKSRSE